MPPPVDLLKMNINVDHKVRPITVSGKDLTLTTEIVRPFHVDWTYKTEKTDTFCLQ